MRDKIVSLNRQFLIIAREEAKAISGEITTRLSRKVLDRISSLSLEEIEKIVEDVGDVLIVRLGEDKLLRLLDVPEERRDLFLVR